MKSVLIIVSGLFSMVSLAQETITRVHFASNDASLRDDSKKTLDSIISSEKQNGFTSRFRLAGHCDSIGTIVFNRELSRRRVHTVHNYLLNNGLVKTQFISIEGQGETQPIDYNSSESGRAMNRRVDIIFTRGETLIEQIKDTATTVGTNIVLKNINFFGGSPEFLPESIPALNELLAAMKQFPKLEIRIEGHICCQPGPNDGINNLTGLPNLSFARARAINDYLVENGIDQARVKYIGLGHSMPIYPYPEQNEEERTINRRVEIKILGK